MEENKQEINNNLFFTRGCCAVPNAYRSENVYRPSCAKLDVYDWLNDIELLNDNTRPEFIEVRFKNSKKEFYKALQGMKLDVGDFVAVESSPGHDIGIVTMTGEAVQLQMRKKNYRPEPDNIKKVYRKARTSDIDKWVSAVEQENSTMFKSKIFASLAIFGNE